MQRVCLSICVAAWLLLALIAAVRAESRVALVIGNGAYTHAPVLANPINDASDMAGALNELGFHVIEAADVDKAALEAKLRQFSEAADGADIALMFYAGHGIQVDGRNYLVPIDAKVERRSAIDFELVDIDRVVAALQNAAKSSLIFLDACRDNPFAKRLSAQSDRALPPRGFAPIETAGAGVLIALSTAPGNVAADGVGRNSPFTSALLRHISTPGLDVNSMLIRVRNDVERATKNQQIPWVSESLSDLVYLSTANPSSEPPRPALAGLCERLVDPQASADRARAGDADAAVRACAEEVNLRPDDSSLLERLKAAKEQRAFKNSMNSNSADASETYLLLYPNGRFVDVVRDHLDRLAPSARPPPAPPAPPRRDLAQDTRALMERYWQISNDASQDGSALASMYGDDVVFYGDHKSLREIIRIKLAYFKEWSLRRYGPPEARVGCDGALCTEEGVVNWRFASESRRLASSGRSAFTFVVDWSSGEGKIVTESGATLSRETHKM